MLRRTYLSPFTKDNRALSSLSCFYSNFPGALRHYMNPLNPHFVTLLWEHTCTFAPAATHAQLIVQSNPHLHLGLWTCWDIESSVAASSMPSLCSLSQVAISLSVYSIVLVPVGQGWSVWLLCQHSCMKNAPTPVDHPIRMLALLKGEPLLPDDWLCARRPEFGDDGTINHVQYWPAACCTVCQAAKPDTWPVN